MTTVYDAKIEAFVACVREMMSAPALLGLDDAIEHARKMAAGMMDSAQLDTGEAAARLRL